MAEDQSPPEPVESEVEEPEHEGGRVHEHLSENEPGFEHPEIHPEDAERLAAHREHSDPGDETTE